VFQSFLIAVFPHLAMGWKKAQGTPALKKIGGGLRPGRREKTGAATLYTA
jgi:hypothetical protein